MEVIIGLLVLGGCAAVGTLALRRRRQRAAAPRGGGQAELLSRDLTELRPADVLLYDGLDLIVVGVASFVDGTTTWREYRLEDGDDERWLLIHPGDGDHALLGHRRDTLVTGDRPSDSLEDQGRVYRLERWGQATVEVQGALGDADLPRERAYWDYASPGAERVWIRQHRDGLAGFTGQRLPRHLLCPLPGS